MQKSLGRETAKDVKSSNDKEGDNREGDEYAINRLCMQLYEPATLANTKAAQFHCADDIFRPHHGANDNRHNHRRQTRNLAENSPLQLVNFKATGTLRIERRAEVARYCR